MDFVDRWRSGWVVWKCGCNNNNHRTWVMGWMRSSCMQIGHASGETELLVLYLVGYFTACGSRPWMESAFPGPAFHEAFFLLFYFFPFLFLLVRGSSLLLWGRQGGWGRGGWLVVWQPLTVIVPEIMAFNSVQKSYEESRVDGVPLVLFTFFFFLSPRERKWQLYDGWSLSMGLNIVNNVLSICSVITAWCLPSVEDSCGPMDALRIHPFSNTKAGIEELHNVG